MKRKELNINIFTKFSFYIALATFNGISIFILLSLLSITFFQSIVELVLPLIFLLSVFGIPLSIVSLFSTESLAKRLFSLFVNASPSGVMVYAFIMEFLDEFYQPLP